MHIETSLESTIDEKDFAALLEESFSSQKLERGDTVTGTILVVDQQGLIVDVNWKRDGLVLRRDLERMGVDADHFKVGEEIDVTVIRMEDDDGNLILSASQARQGEDWKRAEELMSAEGIFDGVVAEANRGGL